MQGKINKWVRNNILEEEPKSLKIEETAMENF